MNPGDNAYEDGLYSDDNNIEVLIKTPEARYMQYLEGWHNERDGRAANTQAIIGVLSLAWTVVVVLLVGSFLMTHQWMGSDIDKETKRIETYRFQQSQSNRLKTEDIALSIKLIEAENKQAEIRYNAYTKLYEDSTKALFALFSALSILTISLAVGFLRHYYHNPHAKQEEHNELHDALKALTGYVVSKTNLKADK
jgi:hypothetical protein